MGWVVAALVLFVAVASAFVFATLAYALRHFSRAGLLAYFEKRGRPGSLKAVVDHEEELALTASVCRAAANLAALMAVLYLVANLFPRAGLAWVYGGTFVAALLVVGLFGVVLPYAVAEHAAEPFIGFFSRLLLTKRLVLLPVVKLYGLLDATVRRMTGHGPGDNPDEAGEELEQEILDIVHEGRAEGVIDDAEREMIERVIGFGDVTAGQAMTSRPEIVGLSADSDLAAVLKLIEETGYSRLPVYAGTLDKVIGVLYARDLFRYVNPRGDDDGAADRRRFRIGKTMRQPLYVPKTKPLADLLRDFQLQKVHMAIVLDEYGGTAGLVTIEDVLEELVGEIADEHEYDEQPLFKRLGDTAAEADAKIEVEELNRLMGLGLPEQEGFETLGGFITTTLGQIPQSGTSFEHETDKGRSVMTVLDAEPQRVNRVRIEVRPKRDATGSAAASEVSEPQNGK